MASVYDANSPVDLPPDLLCAKLKSDDLFLQWVANEQTGQFISNLLAVPNSMDEALKDSVHRLKQRTKSVEPHDRRTRRSPRSGTASPLPTSPSSPISLNRVR